MTEYREYRYGPILRKILLVSTLLLAGCISPGTQQPDAGMGMAHAEHVCNFTPALSVHCGRMPTTGFDQSGRLWVAYVVGQHVYVSHSDDLGKTFSDAMQVNKQPEEIYTNGENRAKVAFGRNGEIYVSWTQVTDGPFYGDIRFTSSLDGGMSFEPVRTVNDDGLLTSHRFETLFVDSKGDIYLTWLDKRDMAAIVAQGGKYTGAALYYTVSTDNGQTFARNLKVADPSCECCRIAMSETPDGDVAVFWRHIFGEDLNIRDHAFAVLSGDHVATAVQRATLDNWQIEACPHHGPAMVSAGDGSYHLTWFTLGDERKGIFYGRYNPDTRQLSNLVPMATTASSSHPYITRIDRQLMLVWKEFDGVKTNIRLAVSDDDGNTWQPGIIIASTSDASDHPLLISRKGEVWLSWHTGQEGLRIISLDHNHLNNNQQVSAQ